MVEPRPTHCGLQAALPATAGLDWRVDIGIDDADDAVRGLAPGSRRLRALHRLSIFTNVAFIETIYLYGTRTRTQVRGGQSL